MSDNRVPQVSVIMAVYNGEKYLHEAVESILNQSFGDFELIITDDGSTDGTLGILTQYASQDTRIRITTNRENLGFAASLNVGIRSARCGLLAIQDADDFSLPNRLELHIDYMARHPGISAVGSGYFWVDRDGDFVAPGPLLFESEELAARMQIGCAFSHCAALFRTEAVRAIGGYRTEFQCSEDYDMLRRLTERFPVAVLDMPVICYRQVSSSMTHARLSIRWRCFDLVKKFAQQRAVSGQDEYEEYIQDSRMPKLSGQGQKMDDVRYFLTLARRAEVFMSIHPMLRFAVRAVRKNPLLLPRAAGIVARGFLRLALNHSGVASMLRTLRGMPSNRLKLKRLAEYRRAWRQYRASQEQRRRASTIEECNGCEKTVL